MHPHPDISNGQFIRFIIHFWSFPFTLSSQVWVFYCFLPMVTFVASSPMQLPTLLLSTQAKLRNSKTTILKSLILHN